MIIWILLITFVVTCLAQLTFNARNEAMTKAAKQAMRQHGANSAPIAVIAWITSAALPVLWTVYAVAEHDWRFAAIGWTPAAAKALNWMLTKRLEPTR